MAISSSGRIVILVDPDLKQQLHALLRRRGTNLKEWFTDQVVDFIDEHSEQLELPLDLSVREGG